MRRGSGPQVSVVLPFRNAASTLGECLDSIGSQSFQRFELIAVDDGSEDDSGRLIQAYAAKDARIRLIQRGRLGLVGALNLGVALAHSPLVARMDADDVMHPDRLGAQRQFMMRRPGLALAGCQVEMFPQSSIMAGNREYIRWQNGCLTSRQIADNLYVESPFAHPSVMIRREVFERVGGYKHGDFPEDYELWLRMAESDCKMAKQPRTLLRWRERPQRLSRTDPRYSREAFDRLRALYLARDPR
ncbi:MAG TPA: glycosyltransferase family A protein, partial [Acidobacteriota bacterium]|nr:glycosyltransferase family A protein [Acidobacteriota bacterium]